MRDGLRRAGHPVDDFKGERVGPLNEFEGEDGFAIAFKPQYLLDGISAAGAGAEGQAGTADGQESDAKETGGTARAARGGGVTLEFTAPDKPAVITGGPGFRYLLAPMRT